MTMQRLRVAGQVLYLCLAHAALQESCRPPPPPARVTRVPLHGLGVPLPRVAGGDQTTICRPIRHCDGRVTP